MLAKARPGGRRLLSVATCDYFILTATLKRRLINMPTGLQLTASKHIEKEREEAVSGWRES